MSSDNASAQHTPAVCAMVLAGGRGSRMGGVDKGLQSFNGVSLVQNAIQRLRQQSAASPPAARIQQLAINANRNVATYLQQGVPVWADSVPAGVPDFAGPLAGILTGLAHCPAECEYLLTVPCDCPLFPLDLLACLAEAMFGQVPEGTPPPPIAMACAPEQLSDGLWAMRRQPVFLLLRSDLGPDLTAYLATGGRKIDAWCQRHPVCEVSFDRPHDRLAFANANTLSELEKLQALVS